MANNTPSSSREIPNTPNFRLDMTKETIEHVNGNPYLISYVMIDGEGMPVPLIKKLNPDGKPTPKDYEDIVRRKDLLAFYIDEIMSLIKVSNDRSLFDKVFRDEGRLQSSGKHNSAKIHMGEKVIIDNEKFLEIMGFPTKKRYNNEYNEAQKIAEHFPKLGDRAMIGLFMDWVLKVHENKTTKK